MIQEFFNEYDQQAGCDEYKAGDDDQFGVQGNFAEGLAFGGDDREDFAQHQETDAAGDDEDTEGDIDAGVGGKVFQAAAEDRETGIAKRRYGVEDRGKEPLLCFQVGELDIENKGAQ